MKKLLLPFIMLFCMLFTACDKDDILPGGPMIWSYKILTPENVEHIGSAGGWVSEYHFKGNSKEGDIVMTCENFDVLNPISGDSYTYDCGWAVLKLEANRLKIHFPPYISDVPEVYKGIKISANDGKRKARAIICLYRTFKDEQP